jgi:pimeloyl-ACP methyl ester carboxylesterase
MSAAELKRTPPQRRVFRDGWGDHDVLAWYASIVRTPPEVSDLEPTVSGRAHADGLVITDYRFDSPAEHLPPASRVGFARLISPGGEPGRVCLLMSSWNDHGYATRTRLARMLADEGIASLILENPLYGDRRADPGDDRPLATVSDFAVMGRAAVVEGLALLTHLRRREHRTGVGGFSMGGNIAAFIGVMAGFPTAIVPVAAPHSPGPAYLLGVMRGSVAFEALGSDDRETRDRLMAFLLQASVLDHEPPVHAAAAVIVAGTNDGFIPTSSVQAIHRHWPGSKLDWVHGGHATMLWRNRHRMAAATVAAFDRIDAGPDA